MGLKCTETPVLLEVRAQNPQNSVLMVVGLGRLGKFRMYLLCVGYAAFLSVTELKHSDQKQLGEGQGLFHLTPPGHTPSLREQTRYSRSEPEVETMEECSLLAHSGSCSARFLTEPRTTCLGMVPLTEG